MRIHRRVCCLFALAALIKAALAWKEIAKPCPEGCEEFGNCNHEFGTCECPFGRGGEGEIAV